MDVDSWVATEGNQDRGLWTRGGVGAHGSVLVADGDAYDDGTNIDTGLMNTSPQPGHRPLRSRARFGDDFLRLLLAQRRDAERKPSRQLRRRGSFDVLKAYDSAALADELVIDERLDIAVNNPASGSMIFEFAYTDASNDWWWAIDNVRIDALAVPEPSVMTLGLLGIATLLLRRRR